MAPGPVQRSKIRNLLPDLATAARSQVGVAEGAIDVSAVAGIRRRESALPYGPGAPRYIVHFET